MGMPLWAKSGRWKKLVCPLFDHLIGVAGEQALWHREAKSLGGLEVDDKLILRRCLYRHVCGLLAFENAVDVTSRAPVHLDPIRAIGNKPAGGDEEAFVVDRRQLVSCRKRDDQIAIMRRRQARGHDQTAIRISREDGERSLDVTG